MAQSTNHNDNDSSATVPTITLNIPDDNSDARSVRSLPPAYLPPTVPPEAHVAEQPANPSNEEPPAYANVVVDMPPSYKLTAEQDPYCVPTNDEVRPWTLTKKLYVCGFLFWPLWFVGAGFCVFGRTTETRQWGRRCVWNSLVVIAIFTYLVVAYIRTSGSGMK